MSVSRCSTTAGAVVAIVGGGVAGLQAAQLLRRDPSLDVIVFEASDRLGGRVRVEKGFLGGDRFVDIGGEYVHGAESVLARLVRSQGWEQTPSFDFTVPEGERMLLGGKLLRYNDRDPDFQHMVHVADEMWRGPPEECTFEEYLERMKVAPHLRTLLSNLVPRTLGTSPDRLGMQGAAVEESLYENGDENFRLRFSMSSLLEHLSRGVNARLNCQIVKVIVDANSHKVTLEDRGGQTHVVDHVIVSVPLTILKSQDITFLPALPASKLRAIDSLGMDAGAKVICKFSHAFWPEDLCIVITDDDLIAQFWTNGPYPSQDPSSSHEQEFIVVGFVMGDDCCGRIEEMGYQAAAQHLVRMLDKAFATTENPAPASDSFLDSMTFNWKNHPYIRGAYSYATLNSLGYRKLLAQPVGSELFFAGEHTARSPATIHTAMETGVRAATEVFQCRYKGAHHPPLAKL